jgi:hypothetical protein
VNVAYYLLDTIGGAAVLVLILIGAVLWYDRRHE